jgi:hypothetical protein
MIFNFPAYAVFQGFPDATPSISIPSLFVRYACIPARVYKRRVTTVIPFNGDTVKIFKGEGGDYPFFAGH